MSFEESKSLAIKIINIYSERMKWGVFSKSIKNNHIPKAKNYSGLIEKIKEFSGPTVEVEKAIDIICKLIGLLKEHAISGEKAVRLAHVPFEHVDEFSSFLHDKLSEYSSRGDGWILECNTSIEANDYPEIVHIIELNKGIALIFNSTRETSSKEEIPHSAIISDYKKDYSEGGKYYYINKINRRCHDVVFFNPINGLVEFRIDNNFNFSTEERVQAFKKLQFAFNRFCKKKSTLQFIDLFPAVSSLYKMPAGDGRVVELSFTTDEGGIKRNKNRLATGGCILNEEFHKGGCKCINDHLTPFKIARVWPFKGSSYNSEPELMLPGTLWMVSLAGVDNRSLKEFVVTKSVGCKDYDMIFAKLCKALNFKQIDEGYQKVT